MANLLTPDKVWYANGVKINEKIIPDNAVATKYVSSWVPKGGKMKPGGSMSPIGITVHNTDDLNNVNDDAEQYTRATWPNCNMGGVCVHLYVDDLGAWQNLEFTEPGWHAGDGDGDGNTRTIAIECVMTGKNQAADIKARDNVAKIIAYLLDKYGWTIDDVYTHNHWLGKPDKIVYDGSKNCPYYLLPKWDEFKSLIVSYMKKNEPETSAFGYDDIKTGSVYKFTGDKQYISANSTSPKKATGERVLVTRKYLENSAHPIHARSVDESGKYTKGIYGWVNVSDLSELNNEAYLVKVTASALNYRKGPGMGYPILGVIRDRGVYTIIQEQNGWGQLKSKAGWISLEYTKKI